MIIECAHCSAKVDGKVLAEHELAREGREWVKYVFLTCPVCGSPHVGVADLVDTGDGLEWSSLTRVWPSPTQVVDRSVPLAVWSSLEEAAKCYGARAYDSCAVMCGRALEGVCVEIVGAKSIAEGLQGLRDKNVIDARLYDWAESLRKERNISAHASGKSTSRQDA